MSELRYVTEQTKDSSCLDPLTTPKDKANDNAYSGMCLTSEQEILV